MKQKKFTLIELLVVIAIIGILASLLLPSLGKARKKAQSAVCKGNLKQLNVILTMHFDDNDSNFPYIDSNISYDDFLSEYDGRSLSQDEKDLNGLSKTTNIGRGSDLYVCPNDDIVRKDSLSEYYIRSYAMPGNGNTNTAFSGVYGNNTGSKNRRNLRDVNSPSEVLTFVELHTENNSLGRGAHSKAKAGQLSISDSPHLNKFNFAFVDGHVESLTFQTTLQTDSGMATDADVTGSMWDATR